MICCHPALLRAMAEKLIPGIPHATRIAILQQSDAQNDSGGSMLDKDKTVLGHVLSSDEARNEAVRTADCKLLLWFKCHKLLFNKVISPLQKF